MTSLVNRRAKLVTMRRTLTQSEPASGARSDSRRQAGAARTRTPVPPCRAPNSNATCLATTPSGASAAQRIATIPGLGPLGSTCLDHTLTRLPYANRDAVVAYTGLVPRPDNSGRKTRSLPLRKSGPSELRHLLFACFGLPSPRPGENTPFNRNGSPTPLDRNHRISTAHDVGAKDRPPHPSSATCGNANQ
jgi:hypothetical protein